MAPGFEEHLDALQARELDHLDRWREAAEFFRAEVGKGRDLGRAVKGLERVFLESHQLPVMIPAMEALARHHVKRRDSAALRRLLRDPEFRPYALPALAKCRVPPELVLDGLTFDTRHDVFRLLRPALRRNPASVARTLLGHPRGRRHLPGLAIDAVQDGLHDLGPVATALGTLLPGKDAVDAMRWLAEAGVDLSGALPALRDSLSARNPDVRSRAAYCLTYDGASDLLAHPKPDVRLGAAQALGVQLCANGRTDLAVPLSLALLDAAPKVRRAALHGLQTALRRGLALPPPPPALVGRPDLPEVAEVGHWWSPEPPAPDDACRLCRDLPRIVRTSYESDVPAEVGRLVPPGPVGNGLRTCPECGNLYSLSYSEEWLSPSEGMGLEVDIRIERLSPPDARRRLRGENLERYGYEDRIRRLERHLEHPDTTVRREAAWGLTRHLLEAGGVERLLAHPDPLVRRECLQTVEDPTPLAEVVEGLLEDPDAAVRARACDLLATHHLATERLQALTEPALQVVVLQRRPPDADTFRRALASPHPEVRHVALRRLEDVEALLPLLDHPDVETRKETLSRLSDLDHRSPEVVRRAAAALDARETRFQAQQVLKAAVGQVDLAPALVPLIRVMDGEDVGWLLHRALQVTPGGADLAPMLAPCLKTVRAPVGSCFQVLLDRDLDLGPVVETLVKTVTGPRPTYVDSYLAAPLARYLARRGDWKRLERLLRAGMDVSGAVSRELPVAGGPDMAPLVPTLQGLLERREWYSREGAAEALRRYAKGSPTLAEGAGP